MAIVSQQNIAVSTSAVPLAGDTSTPVTQKVSVRLVNTGSSTVFLGGAAVTALTGYALTASASVMSLDLQNSETLYGICASATSSTVSVLETGV